MRSCHSNEQKFPHIPLSALIHVTPSHIARVSAKELRELQRAGRPLTIVDVRPVELQAAGRIPGAVTLTMAELSDPTNDLRVSGEVVVYCACPNEASAVIVAKRLMMRGVTRVRPLSGGLDAWVKAGYDTERHLPTGLTG